MKQSQLLFLYLLSSLCNTFELRWPWLEVGLQTLWKGDFSSLERPSRRNCLSWFFPRSLICFPSSCPYFFSFPAEIFHQLSQALAVLTDAAARVRGCSLGKGGTLGCCWELHSCLSCSLLRQRLHEYGSQLSFPVGLREIKSQVPAKSLEKCHVRDLLLGAALP